MKGKGKVCFIRRHNCEYAALAVLSSQTKPASRLGRSPSPRSRTLACSHTAARSPIVCRLIVPISVINVNTWLTTRLLTLEEWKAELAL